MNASRDAGIAGGPRPAPTVDRTGTPEGGSRSGDPVFVVGMPRSGTKLLRALLNRHSLVHIPEHESHFIPHLIAYANALGDLREANAFTRLQARVARTSFHRRLNARGITVDPRRWQGALQGGTYAHAVEALFRLLAADAGKRVWGDKTPQYLTSIPTLDRLFPRARFVHIVRDARDQCLSSQRAWGKSLLRGAQRWADDVARCRRDGSALEPGRYFELRYEDLTHDHASVLTRLCAFLEIPFEADMLSLERPSEALGDARGATRVVPGNVDKWRCSLPPATVRRMEALAADTLRACGYSVEHAGPGARLSAFESGVLQVHDGFAVVLSTLRGNDGDRLRALYNAFHFRPRQPRRSAP